MIYVVLVIVLAAVGYWIHLDTKFQTQRKRWYRREANLEIYNERSEDIASEAKSESEEETTEKQTEANLQLLDDAESDVSDQRSQSPTRWLTLASIGGVVLLTGAGYLIWGDPFAIRLESFPQQFEQALADADLEPIIQTLEQRNSSRHQSAASTTYLIQAHFLNDDFESVVREHDLAEERGTNSTLSDIARVRAAFELDSQSITTETQYFVDRILELEPENPTILQLLAIDSFSKEQFENSRFYLEKALSQPMHPVSAELFDGLLSRAINQLDEDHVGVRVNLYLDHVSTPNQWLTVFAQTDDASPPVAVVRRANAQPGRYTFLLDDIVSMLPERLMSTTERVFVVAQISPQRNVADTTSASRIRSGFVKPSPDASVSLRLSESSLDNTVAVTVTLDPTFEAQENWAVFIIGHRLNTTGAPLLVKRVTVGDLPITLNLTSHDVMLPGATFPEDEFDVFARVSRTGRATRTENDIESERVRARVGQSVALKLNQIVSGSE